MVGLFGLDHDVVNIGLNGSPDEVRALVCSPSVLQTEWHCDIAERSEGGDERCGELVGLFHCNLMVPGVHIK